MKVFHIIARCLKIFDKLYEVKCNCGLELEIKLNATNHLGIVESWTEWDKTAKEEKRERGGRAFQDSLDWHFVTVASQERPAALPNQTAILRGNLGGRGWPEVSNILYFHVIIRYHPFCLI